MILSLLALTAAAEEPAFFQPVAFQTVSYTHLTLPKSTHGGG